MEKKLEKMRKDIQARLKRKIGLLICINTLLIMVVADIFPVHLASEDFSDFISGFQLGLLITLDIAVLNQVVKFQKALKDDAKLKQLYYQEHDERVCYIQQKVGKISVEVTVILMVIIAVIAGYFSFEVFITLIGATFLQSVINIVLKGYYSHTISGEEE